MSEPSIAEVLSNVANVYASCRSYRDDGDVVSTIVGKPPLELRNTARQPFSTVFQRPDRFRFEFRGMTGGSEEKWEHYVIWSEEGLTRSWWTLRPEVEIGRSIEAAIGAAAGVSKGSSCTIPSLLIGTTELRSSLPPAEAVSALIRESWNGHDCIRIDFSVYPNQVSSYWIDAASSLILRIVERTNFTAGFIEAHRRQFARHVEAKPGAFGDQAGAIVEYARREVTPFEAYEETTYRPDLSVDLAPDAFEFTPP
ncbi:MAG TPA: hypothetical protein VMS76_07305 [Planctomycetota bacterium]|nr:hypothetical protein [Planctomycetota bacterium]